MQAAPGVVAFLFTDIEGSSQLWEHEPERMREALARHDAIVREAVAAHRGQVVKMLGDGAHAAFEDPLDAINAAIKMQHGLADPAATGGIALKVRCGLHAGVGERRDNDFFGRAVNRAARIMGVAHGGQVLVSQAVVALVESRLPADVALHDLGNVRLRDLASSERVFQVVHPSLRATFPALRSLDGTPNNLPQQVTSFIGREQELAEVGEAARQAPPAHAARLGRHRQDAPLAAGRRGAHGRFSGRRVARRTGGAAEPRLVPQAVASVLGVKEEAGRPVVEALVQVRPRPAAAVVLDNCEHLVQACAEIADALLASGARVGSWRRAASRCTSRGETPVSVTAAARSRIPHDSFSGEALTQYAAVRLFVERALAVQPAFAVTDENATAVAGICQRLDGIPLALELAAARVRALSVVQIAARLSDRFRLLTSGDRTALPRQQTLRALIDWSFDLLTEPERVLFRRLAVFSGSFTLEAAEAVGAGDAVDATDVLDAPDQPHREVAGGARS